MFSLSLVILGTLIALGGLLAVAPQVRDRRVDPASVGAWIIRAGLLVLIVGEAVAVGWRPDLGLVFKVMLVASGALVFVGLTILPTEWRPDAIRLERTLSWQIIMGGVGAYLVALMFIQVLLMVIGVFLAWIGARASRRWLTGLTDRGQVTPAAFRTQIGLVVLTVILLFF